LGKYLTEAINVVFMPESTVVSYGVNAAKLLKHDIEFLHRFYRGDFVDVVDFEEPEEKLQLALRENGPREMH
jgi:hypothetical protein